MSAFIVSQEQTIFTADQVLEANNVMADLEMFTEDFLLPFKEASLMESDLDPENPSSPWMVEGQKILLGGSEEELSDLSVTDIVVPFSDLGDFKPSVTGSGNCGALVTTCCFPQVGQQSRVPGSSSYPSSTTGTPLMPTLSTRPRS